jgi:hypothetical protein
MAKILRQCTVVRDGQHNAFTDLIHWQGCYWVSYRKGAAHVSMDGEACLSVSTDRKRFREVAHLKVPGDNRDPKLIALNDGRLALYFPTWLGGYQERQLQQYVTFSHDGFHWDTPQPVYDRHWWLWRIKEHNGRYYSAAYTYQDRTPENPRATRLTFLVSDDLLHWELVSKVEGVSGGETGIYFQESGEAWLVTRNSVQTGPAYISRAMPPYDKWENSFLGATVHAPAILEHEGKLFVAGRRHALADSSAFPFGEGQPWGLGVWQLESTGLKPVLHIPAAGDCSYPGLIKDPQGRVCLSYYSAHAYLMGIHEQQFYRDDKNDSFATAGANDIYFAELDLSMP